MAGKISLALNAILIIAVAYLFMNQGATKDSVDNTNQTEQSEGNSDQQDLVFESSSAFDSSGTQVIAYINGDVFMEEYEFVVENRTKLEAMTKASDRKVNAKYEEYRKLEEQWANYFQTEAQTPENMQLAQNDMIGKQMEIEKLEADENNRLQNKTIEFQNELMDRIEVFLDAYSKENNIDLIFSYQPKSGQGLLYTNNSFDITNDVVSGLNSGHQEKAVGNTEE